MTEQREPTVLSYEEQLNALAALVDDWAIKKDRAVKGAFTSGEYVTYRLNQIFAPAHWSFTILDGPTLVTISPQLAYAQVVGRLHVRFSDGSAAHQDDIGIWPLVATKAREGKNLDDTAPERYETVLKAARTDCLKNAARNLGSCFGPLGDLELVAAKKRADYEYSQRDSKPRSAQEDIAELYSEGTPHQKPPEPKPNQETGQATRTVVEPPKKPTKNGLDKLFTEVNVRLAANTLKPYASKEDMVAVLKVIGYGSYNKESHATMVSQLIAQKEPNGKSHPAPGGDT